MMKGDEIMSFDDFMKWAEDYREFFINPENYRKCENCPENKGNTDKVYGLPCRRMHCLIDEPENA